MDCSAYIGVKRGMLWLKKESNCEESKGEKPKHKTTITQDNKIGLSSGREYNETKLYTCTR